MNSKTPKIIIKPFLKCGLQQQSFLHTSWKKLKPIWNKSINNNEIKRYLLLSYGSCRFRCKISFFLVQIFLKPDKKTYYFCVHDIYIYLSLVILMWLGQTLTLNSCTDPITLIQWFRIKLLLSRGMIFLLLKVLAKLTWDSLFPCWEVLKNIYINIRHLLSQTPVLLTPKQPASV